ncbi:MAG: hypothetical protein V2J20_12595 [Wenzhouxiangella sp.]|nr:hypothetical protein [Wenzhouxiangella sp.]
MKSIKVYLAGVLLALAGMNEPSEAAAPGSWQFSGDLRTIYSASWRDTRAGDETNSDTFGGRLRMRLRNDIDSNWRIQGRFATRWEESGNDPEFYIRSARESATAIEPGSMTLDEFFVQYRSDDGRTDFRLGRLQSDFKLPLVTGKSLDRNQASNIDVGWTDGFYLGRQLNESWKATVTGQYNSRDGNGIVTREPLQFDDSGSRISAFATLESNADLGPIFLRALALTWYPDALAVSGAQSPEREDYTAVTFKMAAGWDIGASATRLVVAGSLGHALNRPENAVLGIPQSGQADGMAWQLGADLVELFPRHTAGIVIGQADAGWLISNDYRSNDSLAEFRWSWQISEPLRLQFRARWRREQELRQGAVIAQRDRDIRLRATLKF